MTKEELDKILNTYEWIVVGPAPTNPQDLRNAQGTTENGILRAASWEWKEYALKLEKHHLKETEFLINKIREVAAELYKYEVLGLVKY